LINLQFEGSVIAQWKYVPFYPTGSAVHTKEMYENLQVLLQKICYEEHRWIYGF
jgi:hypothetical protein